MSPGLRIAYLGPSPRPSGGVAGVAGQVLTGLVELGHQVDCYVGRLDDPVPAPLAEHPGFVLIEGRSAFRYGAWYSRTELSKVVSGYALRFLAERRLARELSRRHAQAPYDVVYQFSHVELFDLDAARLPPLVLHPETHAAGELRWVRRERRIARASEPLHRRLATHTLFSLRTVIQRRHAHVPRGFICPSHAFQQSFCDDYGVDPERTRVVPNPIDLERFQARVGGARDTGPVKILFVGRISVRKGIECVVDLSRRLSDLAGEVELDLYGDRTNFSDYLKLLADLQPGLATYHGQIRAEAMPEIMRGADLLIQPSKYEPFGLTVGEALASGVPVVVTSEVGAAEGVSGECARVVPVEDADALEREVRRKLVGEIRGGGGPRLAQVARSEAERLFRPSDVAGSIATVLAEFAR